MTLPARLNDTLPVLSEAGAELVRDFQAWQQIEIRLGNKFLILSRQQARGLLLELATFLSESDSHKTPCVITLD